MILMGIEVEDTAIIEFKNLAFFKKNLLLWSACFQMEFRVNLQGWKCKVYMEMMFLMCGQTMMQERSLKKVLETGGTTITNIQMVQRHRRGSNATESINTQMDFCPEYREQCHEKFPKYGHISRLQITNLWLK